MTPHQYDRGHPNQRRREGAIIWRDESSTLCTASPCAFSAREVEDLLRREYDLAGARCVFGPVHSGRVAFIAGPVAGYVEARLDSDGGRITVTAVVAIETTGDPG